MRDIGSSIVPGTFIQYSGIIRLIPCLVCIHATAFLFFGWKLSRCTLPLHWHFTKEVLSDDIWSHHLTQLSGKKCDTHGVAYGSFLGLVSQLPHTIPLNCEVLFRKKACSLMCNTNKYTLQTHTHMHTHTRTHTPQPAFTGERTFT